MTDEHTRYEDLICRLPALVLDKLMDLSACLHKDSLLDRYRSRCFLLGRPFKPFFWFLVLYWLRFCLLFYCVSIFCRSSRYYNGRRCPKCKRQK